jgi:hypothetical protein
MTEPMFDLTPESHVFNVGDSVYVIDGNNIDLLKARIKKKYTKGYLVHFDDEEEEDTKFKDNHRILIRNEINNEIFESQQQARKQHPAPPPKPEIESEEDEPDFEDFSIPAKRPARPKRGPVLKPEGIVQSALAAGVTDTEGFQAYISEKTAAALQLFEDQQTRLAIDVRPPFALGGGIGPEDVTNFWKQAKAQWIELFGPTVSVGADRFVRTAAEAWRGDFDTAAARTLLYRTFEPEPGEQVNVVEYSGFLAQFGPISELMRKLDHYWRCPAEAREALQPLDLSSVIAWNDPLTEDGNSFEIETANGTKIVYNLITVEPNGQYLVDDSGTRYSSWITFCEANPPKPESSDEEES